MELTGCQQDPPSRDIPPQSYAKPRSEEVEANGVEEAQDRSNDKLGVGKAEDSNQRLAEAGQEHRPYKRARNGPRKSEVVIKGMKASIDV